MSVHRGAIWTQRFVLKYASTGLPIDITGWEFKADFQRTPTSDELVTLTSANGGFSIISALDGTFQMLLTDDQTELLPVGRVKFDVIRTDAIPGPVFLFGGSIKVKELVSA